MDGMKLSIIICNETWKMFTNTVQHLWGSKEGQSCLENSTQLTMIISWTYAFSTFILL